MLSFYFTNRISSNVKTIICGGGIRGNVGKYYKEELPVKRVFQQCANHTSAKCHIYGRSANLTNYKSANWRICDLQKSFTDRPPFQITNDEYYSFYTCYLLYGSGKVKSPIYSRSTSSLKQKE